MLVLDPEDYRVSTLTTGRPGSGKSSRVVRRIVEAVEGETPGGERLVDLIVLHDTEYLTARDVAVQLIGRGYGHCVHWDDYDKFSRVLGGLSPQPSEDPCPHRRRAEDQQRLDNWLRILWQASDRVEEGGKDIFGMASLYTAALLGSRVIFYQAERKNRDFGLLPYLAQVRHKRCRELVAGVDMALPEAREARGWWEYTLELAGSPRLLEDRIGVLERFLRQAYTPQLEVRLGGEFIVDRLMRERRLRTQVVILDGSGGSVPQRAVTALTHAWDERGYQSQQRYFLEHGRPFHTVVVWEEMAANRSFGPREVFFTRKGRKLGWHPWGVATDFAFADPATREAMTKLFRRKEWHNPGDSEMAKQAGEDWAYRTFDLHMVHSVETSVQQIRGRPRKEKKVTQTTSRDQDGKERTGTSESEADVYDFDTITLERKKYVGLDDQVKLKAGDLLGMDAGWLVITHLTERKQYVSAKPEYSPIPEEQFDEEVEPGLADRKLGRLIERSQSSDYFLTPEPPAEPCETKPEPPPPPKLRGKKTEGKPKVPPATPKKAATRGGRKGTTPPGSGSGPGPASV